MRHRRSFPRTLARSRPAGRAPVLHPPGELLVDFACGRADLPHRVMIEAHLAHCATCTGVVADLATPGGALLAELPDVAPGPGAFERLWQAVERQEAQAPPPPSSPIPAGAWAELPIRRRALRWRPLPTLGAHFAGLARDPATGTMLSVARMGGGRRFPRHRHVGGEDVVVLQGAYRDQVGEFASGDWGSYEDGSEHAPDTVAGAECWILTRLHHRVRFLGWRGVLQRLLGI